MKRPVGISILAVVLLLLSFAGFGNAYIMLSEPSNGTPVLAVLAFVYGVTALIASVGLWMQRKWAYWTFLSWATAALATAITMQFSFVQAPWPKLLVFLLIVVGILWALARYVRKASLSAL